MINKDLNKESLYEAVKALVECEHQHIHLPQQKLFTLFSVAFQYMLFRSTKNVGHYIIRVEDSSLCDKLQRKAKDDITRKFMTKIGLPRKFKYGNSTFHLDFFNFATWNQTQEIPPDRIQGALIVKNTTPKPLTTEIPETEEDIAMAQAIADLPEDYYLYSLTEFVPKTITIAFEKEFENVHQIRFPFIKDEPREKLASGVKIAADLELDDDV